MAGRKLILVSGATGQQGGAVTRSLLGQGQNVRCLTRSPEKARVLQSLGAEIVQGDFGDPESLRDALRGVDGMFLVGTPFEKGMDAEVAQGKAAIDACRKEHDLHVVYTSVTAADKRTGIPHFETKARVEQYLKASGLRYTIFRPVFFMENLESPWLYPSVQQGVLRTPLLAHRPLQMIALRDIGEFAAAAFLRPGEFVGKAIDLAGDRITLTEAVLRISRALGKPVRYEAIPASEAEKAVGHDMALMYKWFNEAGYAVDIGALRNYGIHLTSFPEYLSLSKTYGRKAA